jgi:hypothetical protein
MRRQHSAVESAINALEVHGLDRCPDHGIKGFERYVALAVLAKTSTVSAPSCVKRKKNGSVVNEDPTKKAA